MASHPQGSSKTLNDFMLWKTNIGSGWMDHLVWLYLHVHYHNCARVLIYSLKCFFLSSCLSCLNWWKYSLLKTFYSIRTQVTSPWSWSSHFYIPPLSPPSFDFACSTAELHFKLHVLTLNMKGREDWVLLMVVQFERRIVLTACSVSVTLYLVVADY